MKKLLALTLAALLLTSASTAFAALPGDEVDDPNDITGGAEVGGTVLPLSDLYVRLPTFDSNTLTFDPYNQSGEGDQIASALLTFTNESTVPVELFLQSYTARTTSRNAIVPVTDPALVEVGTAKNLLLWLDAARCEDGRPVVDGDGKHVFAPYNPATDSGKVIRGFGINGAIGSVQQPNQSYGILLRGKSAKRDPVSGALSSTPIDPAVLNGRNTAVLRFDGSMNTGAHWDDDEGIVITPVFGHRPLPLDTGAEKLLAALTPPDGLVLEASAITLYTGQTFTLTSDLPPTPGQPIPKDGYAMTVTSADGTVNRPLNSVTTKVMVNGNSVTVTVRCSSAVPGDIFTLRLLPSAFPDPATSGSTRFTAVLS